VGKKIVAVIQARMTSTRLPGKVLLPLAGAPLLQRMVERVARITGLDAIWLAIPEGAQHDPIIQAMDALSDIGIFRGDETDVLARTYLAARRANADVIMRMTSDCPLIDPEISGEILAAFLQSPVTYARTAFSSGYPHGFDTEVFTMEALSAAYEEATEADEREHVTPFIWRRRERFPALEVDYQPDFRHWRLTVDTPEDYDLVSRVFARLYPQDPEFGFSALKTLFAEDPSLLEINADSVQPTVADMPGAPR
jgi:spore coat polysaccharide biosynthesis protein SpsF